jgi:hypothetical protein
VGTSESYHGLTISLCFAAGALLAYQNRCSSRWTGLTACVAAGLLATMAARVHPLAWPAVLVLPGILVLPLINQQQSAIRCGWNLVAYTAALAVGAVGVVGGVLAGELGQQWEIEGVRTFYDSFQWAHLGGCAMGLLGAIFWGRARRLLLLATLAWLGAWSAHNTNIIQHSLPMIQSAFFWSFAPFFLAVFAAATANTESNPQRWHIALSAAFGLALVALTWTQARLVTYPTDVREQHWALQQLRDLPPDAHVIHVERAGSYLMVLPIWRPAPFKLTSINGNERLGTFRLMPGNYYYRSHLCSEPEAKPHCVALEASACLQAIAEKQLPAISSSPHLPLTQKHYRVGLYKVVPRTANGHCPHSQL